MDTCLHEGLKNRYLIQGEITMETAFHIGSSRGDTLVTDKPILRNAYGRPIIPGSSIKGAFRSAIERIVFSLDGVKTCALIDGYKACLTTSKGLQMKMEENRNKLEMKGTSASTIEDNLLKFTLDNLCHTCLLFGSPYTASKVLFHDLRPLSWAEVTEIRDGVAIDRDSERAVDNHKFDFEVVPSQALFSFTMQLENPTTKELGLIAVGLQEFRQGLVPLGGMKSRGLGKCKLKEDIEIRGLELQNYTQLSNYLVKGQMEKLDTETFIEDHIKELLKNCFSAKEARDKGGPSC